MEIERGRGVARCGRYRPQRRPLQPVRFEYLAGGIEDQLALEVAHGLPAARHPFFRHPVSITHLTVYLTVLEF